MVDDWWMVAIGIDPGLSGAIAVVGADGQYVEHIAKATSRRYWWPSSFSFEPAIL